MTHEDVVRRYVEQRPNWRTGTVEWHGHNVFVDGGVLYHSHGRRFLMAKVIVGEDGERVFLKNGDRYSAAASGFQRMVQRWCPGPTISFDVIERAGISPRRVTSADVSADVLNGAPVSARLLDWVEDGWTALRRKTLDSPWCYTYAQGPHDGGDVFRRPDVGMLIPLPLKTGGPILRAAWHIPGAALFLTADRDSRHRHILAILDEGHYSAIELSSPARTVRDALSGLKPEAVLLAEAAGIEVRRQGEWYAIPRFDITARTLREVRSVAKAAALPRRYVEGRGLVGAAHICPHVVTPAGVILARGVVRHVPFGSGPGRRRARPEHRAMCLGSVWHQMERNTERMSWSAVGRGSD